MKYTYEQVKKITEYKTYTDKQKVDRLLEIDCSLYAHLGTDSTKHEKNEVKKLSHDIYRLIKSIDDKLGNELLYSEDLKK